VRLSENAPRRRTPACFVGPRRGASRLVTVRVVLRLTCNVRRTRGCHGAYELVLGAWVLPGAEARVRLDAATTGWTREAGGKDACPACSGTRPAARSDRG
jgi:hypothetical protein